MNNHNTFDRILKLRLSGKFAHFRKFYTNASSLSYTIPPRTVICGLLASIAQIPRDGYYDTYRSEQLGIAIAIPNGSSFQKIFQTMNYAQDKSSSKPVNDLSAHKQCRLELLKATGNKELVYYVYLGFNNTYSPLKDLEAGIIAQNFGYGVYFGQRQFIAHLELLDIFQSSQFSFCSRSNYLDSAICKQQVQMLDTSELHISMERMPLEQNRITQKRKDFRQTIRLGDVIFETTGRRLHGDFTDLIELQNDSRERIAWL